MALRAIHLAAFRSKSYLAATIVMVFLMSTTFASQAQDQRPLRLGIIGLDTSHCVAFTKAFHDPNARGPVAGIRIVAAFPAGSPDLPASRDRVQGFTETLRAEGVEIVASIDELLPRCDGVLIESVDGRPHLDQVKAVVAAGKPFFLDKPVAASLADCVTIFRLAQAANVPCFSSSSLRFSPGILNVAADDRLGGVRGCDAYGPCPTEPHHPDLYWYGIHGVETLFTIMGPGCEQVTRVKTEGTDLVVGVWKDGRVGTFRGIRQGKADYGALVFGEKAVVPAGPYVGYGPLVEAIALFFRTGKPPVSAEETIEIYAFMSAAQLSGERGGATIAIAEVINSAQQE